MKRFTIKQDCYNQRRYSRPWICKIISWNIGRKSDVEWGEYNGDDMGGVLEIMANNNDVIHYGQKDNRGGRNTINEWYIIKDDKLVKCTKAEAREMWYDNHCNGCQPAENEY